MKLFADTMKAFCNDFDHYRALVEILYPKQLRDFTDFADVYEQAQSYQAKEMKSILRVA